MINVFKGFPMFKHISVADAAELIKTETCNVVDIRDSLTFSQGYIPESINLHQDNLADFIKTTSKNSPLLVCCYHGISSQGAANMLIEQGFNDVYSIDGGFESWRLAHPIGTTSE